MALAALDGCATSDDPPAAARESITGGRDDIAPPDAGGKRGVSQRRRDAVVGLSAAYSYTGGSGNCSGTLIGPRTILTAYHCTGDVPAGSKVGFGARASNRAPDLDLPPPMLVSTVGCAVHPGATGGVDAGAGADGGVAHCGDLFRTLPDGGASFTDGGPGAPGVIVFGPVDSAHDVGVEILDRRFDVGAPAALRPRTRNYPVIPAGVSLTDIVPTDGRVVGWSSAGWAPLCHFPDGGSAIVDGGLTPPDAGGADSGVYCDSPGPDYRQLALAHFAADPAFPGLIVIAQLADPARTQVGDSGGGWFVGDPDVGPMSVLSVSSRGANSSAPDGPSLGERSNAAFVRQFVDVSVVGPDAQNGWFRVRHSDGTSHLVWLGPADITQPGEACVAGGTPCRATAPGSLVAADPDGDGLSDTHDNCTTIFNPDQLDVAENSGVGDGVGDVAPVTCVDSLGTTHAWGCGEFPPDHDGDGEYDPCDNCPEVANGNQANCNADSEAQEHVAAVGDACDPQPCPDLDVVARTESSASGTVLAVEQLQIDPIATAAAEARTGLRWCTCASATDDSLYSRRLCIASGPVTGDGSCTLDAALLYRDVVLPPPLGVPNTWMFPTVTFVDSIGVPVATVTPPGPPGVASLPAELVAAYQYPPPVLVGLRLHDERTFVPRAVANWNTVVDERFFGIAGEPFRGVLWAHAPGNPPTGTSFDYFGGLTSDLPSELLTSRYWSGELPRPVSVGGPLPPSRECVLPAIPVEIPQLGFPFGPMLGTDAWIGFGGAALGRNCFYGRLLPPPEIMLPGGFFMPDPAALLHGDPSMFQIEGKWVAAAEPADLLPTPGIRYLGLSVDNSTALRTLVATSSGAIQIGGVQGPPIGCDNPNGCPKIQLDNPVLGADPAPLDAPGDPRTDALVVLSARRAALFVGGGVAPDGTALHDLSIYDAVHATWSPVGLPDGAGIGRTLAATYSPLEDALYALDRGSARRGRRTVETVRLLRIAATGTSFDVLAEWPVVAHLSRYAMAVAPDGDVYVAASADRGAHVVARLGIEGARFRLLGFAVGRGAIVAGQARATRRRLTLMTVSGLDVATAVGYDVNRLPRPPAGWEERCF